MGTNKSFEYCLKKYDHNLQNKFLNTGHVILRRNMTSIIVNSDISTFLFIWQNRRTILCSSWRWYPEGSKSVSNDSFDENYVSGLFTSCIKKERYDLIDLLFSLGYILEQKHYVQILKKGDKKLEDKFLKYEFIISEKIMPYFILNKSIDNIKQIIEGNNFSKKCINSAIEKAVEKKRLDIVEYFFEKGYETSKDILKTAIRTKSMDVVDYFIEYGYEFNKMHVKEAIRYGNLQLLQILESKGFKYQYLDDKTKEKWKKSRRWYRTNPNALDIALDSGDLQTILHVIRSNRYKLKKLKGWRYSRVIRKLIDGKRSDIIRELAKENKIDNYQMIRCVRQNNIEILKVFIETDNRFLKQQTKQAVEICIYKKYHDMLCYLFEIGIRFTEKDLNYAILEENSDDATKIVNFILSKGTKYDKTSPLNAIKAKNFDRLKHIFETGKEQELEINLTSRLVTLALELKQTKIVDYLLNEGLKMTSSGLNYSIMNRSVGFCKKLVKNGVKPNSKSMDHVIKRYTNLSFLKFIKENGGNFSSEGLDNAFKKGNSEIIDYLLSLKTAGNSFTSELVRHAVEKNDLKLIKKLYNLAVEEWSELTEEKQKDTEKLERFDNSNLMVSCVKGNKIRMLKYLIGLDLKIFPDLIDNAAKQGNLKILKYLISIDASFSTDAVDWVFKYNPKNSGQVLGLLWDYHKLKKQNEHFCTENGIIYAFDNCDNSTLKFILGMGIPIPNYFIEGLVCRYNLDIIEHVHNLGYLKMGYIIENSIRNSIDVVKFLVDNDYKVENYDELIYYVGDDGNYEKLKYIFNNTVINQDFLNNVSEWTVRMLFRNKAIKILALLLEKGFILNTENLINNKTSTEMKKVLFAENADYKKIQETGYKFSEKQTIKRRSRLRKRRRGIRNKPIHFVLDDKSNMDEGNVDEYNIDNEDNAEEKAQHLLDEVESDKKKDDKQIVLIGALD